MQSPGLARVHRIVKRTRKQARQASLRRYQVLPDLLWGVGAIRPSGGGRVSVPRAGSGRANRGGVSPAPSHPNGEGPHCGASLPGRSRRRERARRGSAAARGGHGGSRASGWVGGTDAGPPPPGSRDALDARPDRRAVARGAKKREIGASPQGKEPPRRGGEQGPKAANPRGQHKDSTEWKPSRLGEILRSLRSLRMTAMRGQPPRGGGTGFNSYARSERHRRDRPHPQGAKWVTLTSPEAW